MRASWLACSACLVPLVVAACSNMSGSIGPPAVDNRETDATPIVTGVAPYADGSAPMEPCARKPAPDVRPAVVGAASGFAKAGTIAVLRDDGAAGPRIELEEGRAIEPGCVNHVDFDFRDFTGRDSRASYELDEAVPQFANVPWSAA